jgi:X-X-X-leu-X-X-gly heptad repeats
MKLPELKEKLKSKYIVRVVAGVLTIALVGTGIGATAVFAEKNSTAVTAEADSTTGSSKDADDIADKLMDSVSLKDNDADKDESVYLISDANGNVNKTIVVDHLKNKDKKDTLEDASNLSDIENVKGKEKFTQSGDKLTWQAGGKDIYYQGTATEEPPVTQKVTYYLDGKEISPEDLAGKSGKVKIRFDYTNTTSYTETVNGEKQTVSVPFAAITGLVLGDGFENIEVTNGKAEVSDSSSVVLGYALPGLKDSLGIKDKDLDGDVNIPEYMEMTADVKNFSMPAAMTFVVNASDYVSTDGIDTSDLDDMINDLKDASTQLQDGSKTLAEGTDTLADGLSTLQSKLGTFASGVGTLQSGLKTYTDGVSTLSGGLNTLGNSTGALVSGADKLNSGAGQLASGSATLKDGLKSYTDGANGLAKGASDLDAGIGTLAEKSGTLVDGATKLDDGASQLSASASSINEGIKSLDTGLKTPLTDKEKAGYQAAAKDSVDKQFSNPDNEANYENTKAKASGVYYETMTSDDSVKQAVQLLKNDSDLMNMINATVGATVETAIKGSVPDLASKDTATIKKTYNNSPKLQQSVKEVLNLPQTIPDYDALVSAIVDQKLNDMATKVMAGVANNSKDKVGEAVADAAKTGAENAAQSAVITGIESAKSNVSSQINAKQENGYSLVTGADALSTGASSLANGTKSLVNSIPTLTGGIKQLKDGSSQLNAGAAKLTSNNDTLNAGATALNAGASQLSAGTQSLMNSVPTLTSGIKQLVDGSNTLVANNAQLNSGASQLADGTNQIVSGVDQLTIGSKTLSEGAHTLADGMVQFNEEGINKILDAYNGDLKPFTNKLQAVIDAGEEYQTYSAIADGQTGSVKFIYKLASIDAKADSDK